MSTQPSAPPRPRRIACVQLDSKHADVPRNIGTVLALVTPLLANRELEPVDLVVLPELALTGYVFDNEQEISPLLEDASDFSPPPSLLHSTSFIAECRSSCAASRQPSLTLASHLAQQLECHVVVGFPERHRGELATGAIDSPFDARPEEDRGAAQASVSASSSSTFNSAALLSPSGALLHVFRKHFLFETDKVWASPGNGFELIHIPFLGNVCVAICMDLNPYEFKTSFDKFELASFCVDKDIDLLVMPMAWLMPKQEESEELTSHSNEGEAKTSLSTINYWAMRCYPFVAKPQPPTKGGGATARDKPRFLVAANRVGTEATSTFGGSSCVLQMDQGERPLLLDSLSSTREGCLVVALSP